ncbi:MAG: amino acid ABC transporter permease [Arenicella sp.]
MDYEFLWRPVFQALPQMLKASLITIEIAVLSMVIGTICALFLFFARESKHFIIRFLSGVWIEVARNTPALFQLFFFKFGLGAIGIIIDSYITVLMALVFNVAGYMAETFRGGFKAVPPSQLNSARSLGMSFFQAQIYVVIPQVLRAVWHPMSNQFIWVMLLTSLGMLVGLRELSGETQFLYSKTFRAFEFFAMTAVIYYCIAKITLGLFKLIGWRFLKVH